MVNESLSGLREGQVKWFNDTKGYGFIVIDDAPDIFVHYSAIKMEGFRTLKEGDLVRFELLHSTKGLQAINVTKLDSEGLAVNSDNQASGKNGKVQGVSPVTSESETEYEPDLRRQSAG